ncbi:MAG: hypothetical protein ACP5VN_11295 [Acidobacteriota bacterium]
MAGGLLLLWLAAATLLSSRHEPWRDEVRALTLATEPAHGWELPSLLRNEGHPVLWYLLLRFAHDLFGTTAVLKGTSIAVAFLSVCLLFWRAPFPLWWKALFAFSFLPLYEYSVLARNYGLTMALAFAFAAAYPQRGRRPYLLALILALLANSNLHSLPLAGGFLALWLWEDGLSGGWKGGGRRLGRLALPTMAVVVAGAFALWTCLPEGGTLPPGASVPSPAALLGTLGAAALHPGETFPVLLPLPGWMRDLALWGLLAGFAGWIPGLLLLLGYDLALQVLFRTVYPGGLRQQGLLLVAFVAVAWMARGREETRQAGEDRSRRLPRALSRLAFFGLLPLLFGLHLYLSKGPLRQDWRRPFTSAPALAALLRGEPGLRGAILVPEPDCILESLPYYSSAPIYLPREGAFARRVSYSSAFQKELTLGELQRAADGLKARYGVPVLVVWGHGPLRAGEAGEAALSGGKPTRWTGEEASAFLRATTGVVHFQGAISDENYLVYRLNP